MSFKKSVCLLLCVLMTAGLLCGCRSPQGKRTYVAMIAKSTESAFWKSVYSGAQAAANEYNLDISFEGPDNEEDYTAQNKMLENAVARNADVIVLSAIDYNKSVAEVEAAVAAGVRVISIDSDINSGSVSSRIGTDNYKAGQTAAEAVLKRAGALRVGIVNFDINTRNGQDRERGFRERLAQESRVSIYDTINAKSNTEAAKQSARALIAAHPDMNVIVTFNEWTSLGVGYAVEELGLKEQIDVIAFDNNVVSVRMLETGEVDALVVQTPFAMGYLAVEYAGRLANNKPVPEQTETKTTLVTRDNMYDADIQKILFPFD